MSVDVALPVIQKSRVNSDGQLNLDSDLVCFKLSIGIKKSTNQTLIILMRKLIKDFYCLQFLCTCFCNATSDWITSKFCDSISCNILLKVV